MNCDKLSERQLKRWSLWVRNYKFLRDWELVATAKTERKLAKIAHNLQNVNEEFLILPPGEYPVIKSQNWA